MPTELHFWLTAAGLILAIVVPVGLTIHAAGRARSDRNAKRLDDHHERIVRTETKLATVDGEVEKIRPRVHKHADEITALKARLVPRDKE